MKRKSLFSSETQISSVTSFGISFSRSIYARWCKLFSLLFFLFFFFHLNFVFFFSSRLAIVPHARWKLPVQAHEGCFELIGGFLQLFVYRLYSLLSFLKVFELINSEGLQNNQLINKNVTPSLLAPLCFDSPCIWAKKRLRRRVCIFASPMSCSNVTSSTSRKCSTFATPICLKLSG